MEEVKAIVVSRASRSSGQWLLTKSACIGQYDVILLKLHFLFGVEDVWRGVGTGLSCCILC